MQTLHSQGTLTLVKSFTGTLEPQNRSSPISTQALPLQAPRPRQRSKQKHRWRTTPPQVKATQSNICISTYFKFISTYFNIFQHISTAFKTVQCGVKRQIHCHATAGFVAIPSCVMFKEAQTWRHNAEETLLRVFSLCFEVTFTLFSLSLKSKLQELLGAARLYLANILSQEMLSAPSAFWCRAEQLSAKPQSSTIKKSSTNFFASEKCSHSTWNYFSWATLTFDFEFWVISTSTLNRSHLMSTLSPPPLVQKLRVRAPTNLRGSFETIITQLKSFTGFTGSVYSKAHWCRSWKIGLDLSTRWESELEQSCHHPRSIWSIWSHYLYITLIHFVYQVLQLLLLIPWSLNQ